MQTHKQIGRVTSASVEKATGKGWDEWLAILDKAGARTWTHQEIVAYLKKRHKLGPWWQQGVTLGYEIATGRRVEGQNAKGEYSLTVTKSLHLDAKSAWKLLCSQDGQALWLKPLFEIALRPGSQFETEDGFFGEIRTLQKGRKMRMRWQDPDWEKPTTVELLLVAKPKGRSILAFNHGQIKDPKTQSKLRDRWKAAIEDLNAAAKDA